MLWRHDELFVTSWRVVDIMTNFFGVWTNFMTSWRVFFRDEPFDVMTYFWHDNKLLWRHDELFDIMTYFWHHNKYLTTWPIFNTMGNCLTSWRIAILYDVFLSHDKLFDVLINFLTSWWPFGRNDVFLTFWYLKKSCHDHRLFDIMTYVWCHDELFGIMTWFRRHDELFDVMTYFWHYNKLFWHHDDKTVRSGLW